MKRSVRILLSTLVFLCAQGALPLAMSEVAACPSCKNANEADSRRPRAYMYSILFMLAMPATVFTGFGISFYRLSRKSQLEQLAALSAAPDLNPSDDVREL